MALSSSPLPLDHHGVVDTDANPCSDDEEDDDEQQQPQLPKEDIEHPHLNDVLCGRGVTTNKYPGNEKFRSLVGLNKELYVTSTKRQKMAISRSIVEAVRSMNPPGRFLEKDPETSLWSDIGDRKAIEKTSQALRDGAASLRKQLSADLGDPDFLSAVFDMDAASKKAAENKGKDGKKDAKTGKEKADKIDKSKLAKARQRTVKKGHRRTRSNPDMVDVGTKKKSTSSRKTKGGDGPESPKSGLRRLGSMSTHSVPASPCPITGRLTRGSPNGEYPLSPSAPLSHYQHYAPEGESFRDGYHGQRSFARRSSSSQGQHSHMMWPPASPHYPAAAAAAAAAALARSPPYAPTMTHSPMSAGHPTRTSFGGRPCASPPARWSPASFSFSPSPMSHSAGAYPGGWRTTSPMSFPGYSSGELTLPNLQKHPHERTLPYAPSMSPSRQHQQQQHLNRRMPMSPPAGPPPPPYTEFAPPPSPVMRRGYEYTATSSYREVCPSATVSNGSLEADVREEGNDRRNYEEDGVVDEESNDQDMPTPSACSSSAAVARSSGKVSPTLTLRKTGGSGKMHLSRGSCSGFDDMDLQFDEKKEEDERSVVRSHPSRRHFDQEEDGGVSPLPYEPAMPDQMTSSSSSAAKGKGSTMSSAMSSRQQMHCTMVMEISDSDDLLQMPIAPMGPHDESVAV